MGPASEFGYRLARKRTCRRTASSARGFTLIELLIAMVVLAILATIAYPTYTDFVRRSRIVDATSQLNDFRTRQEQAFQDNRRFDDGGGNCGIAAQMPVFVPARDNFQFTCVFLPGALGGYRLDATGNGAVGMGAFQYRLETNPATGALTRSTIGVHADWLPLPAPNTCWQTRKAGKCS